MFPLVCGTQVNGSKNYSVWEWGGKWEEYGIMHLSGRDRERVQIGRCGAGEERTVGE